MDITLEIADKISKIDKNATIYVENQEQGFNEPSYFIQRLPTKNKKQLSGRSMRNYNYAIMYFPENGSRRSCEVVEEMLLEKMTKIDSISHLYDVESKIIDNALQFLFTLKLRVVDSSEEGPFMNHLEEVSNINV